MTHLKRKIRNLTSSLLAYREGRITPDQIGEECHTVVELLLKTAFPSENPMTFAAMVIKAHEANYLNDRLKDRLLRIKNSDAKQNTRVKVLQVNKCMD